MDSSRSVVKDVELATWSQTVDDFAVSQAIERLMLPKFAGPKWTCKLRAETKSCRMARCSS